MVVWNQSGVSWLILLSKKYSTRGGLRIIAAIELYPGLIFLFASSIFWYSRIPDLLAPIFSQNKRQKDDAKVSAVRENWEEAALRDSYSEREKF